MSSKGHQKSHFHGNSPSVQRRGLFGGKIAIHASENDSHATRPRPPSRELPAIFADSAPLFIPKLGEICEEGRRSGERGEHEQLVASLQQCDGIQLSRVQTAWHGMRSEREGERGGAKQISNLGGGESG